MFLIVGGYAVHEVQSQWLGITDRSKVGCGECHAPSKSPSTIVTISTQVPQIIAGQTYIFSICVKNANGIQQVAGCDISVDNGAKLSVDPNDVGPVQNWPSTLHASAGELTHAGPRVLTDDSAVWTFKYTAPTQVGVAHIYAAGNAANLNSKNDPGDLWNTTVYTVNVVSAAGPQLTLPSSVQFRTLTGSADTQSIWLKNNTNASLIIGKYGLKVGAAFQIADSATHDIVVGDSATIRMLFNPSVRGTFIDTLRIRNIDESVSLGSVALIGTSTAGELSISTSILNFGLILLTETSALTSIIKNTGNGSLTISSIRVSSPSKAFQLVGLSHSGAFPSTLQPSGLQGSSITDTFGFSPVKLGFDTAIVTISYTETSMPPHDTIFYLIGQGSANSSVASNSQSNFHLSIFPNPSNGKFTLSAIGEASPLSLNIINSTGQTCFQ